jgi:type IV secretion system protein VirB3
MNKSNDHDDEIEGYEVPLHLALTQPVLFAGTPRAIGILNVTLALALGMGLRVWWLAIPLGLFMHSAAVWLTKRDFDWFDVLRVHLRQPTHLDS